jgi:hypothetical protein
VRALEQQGELLGPDGARKKEMAIVMLRQLFAKFSIDISEDLLDHLIEAAVQTINTEDGELIITRIIHQLVGKCTDPCYNVFCTVETKEAENHDRHDRSFVGGADGGARFEPA